MRDRSAAQLQCLRGRHDLRWRLEGVLVQRIVGPQHCDAAGARRLPALDVDGHRRRLGRAVDDLDDDVAGFVVASADREDLVDSRQGLLLHKLTVEIAAHGAIPDLDFDVVPTAGLNRAADLLADDSVGRLDGVAGVAPATDVPLHAPSIRYADRDDEALAPRDLARLE